jgi:DNA-directed RNA polymerase
VGVNDHSAQRQWEHYQVQRGIDRYKASLTQEVSSRHGSRVREKTLAEVAPGGRIASDLMGPLVTAIRAKQAEYREAYGDPKNRNMSEDAWAILSLSAETLAACTILSAQTAAPDATYTGVSRDVASRVQHEIEYAQWREAERKAAEGRKDSGAEFVPDLFKLMVKRNDVVDQRVFDKWSKKSALFAEVEWDQKMKVRVGGVLVTLLVESNAWYEVVEEFMASKNRTKLMFRMTELGLSVLSRLHDEFEYQRPFMLPMICEPRDYEYVEPVDQPASESEAFC